MKVVHINGYPIMIYEKDGKEYAWLAGCPHKKRPILAEGHEIRRDIIKCPFHGAEFSLITGELVKQPDSKTPCPPNCKLIKAIIKGDEVEFEGTPFMPEYPKRK